MGIKIIIPFRAEFVHSGADGVMNVESETHYCHTCEHEPYWRSISAVTPNRFKGQCRARDYSSYENRDVTIDTTQGAYIFHDFIIKNCPAWKPKKPKDAQES